jgi:hypothetical protein
MRPRGAPERVNPPAQASGDGSTALFAWLVSHQPAVPFLSEQNSHPQPASSALLSEQTSTSHQPPANRTRCTFRSVRSFNLCNRIRIITQAPCISDHISDPSTNSYGDENETIKCPHGDEARGWARGNPTLVAAFIVSFQFRHLVGI